MAQDKLKKQDVKSSTKNGERKKSAERKKEKKKDDVLYKVVIRRLPPTWTEETVLEQLSPVPDHDYFYFVKADHSLGQHAFSRAYINFQHQADIFVFKEKFDGYIFLDSKGNEFPAVVEFAPFPKKPKRTQRKADPRCGTIEQDPEYQKFLDSLNNPVLEPVPAPEVILEEIETREKELKVSHGVAKLSTPLLDYIKKKKEDKKAAILKAREERKKREIERRRQREEEKRKQREREREKQLERKRQRRLEQQEKENDKKGETPTKVVLLKNPEREKDHDSGSGECSNKPKGQETTRSGSSTESHGKELGRGEMKGKSETASSRSRDYNQRMKAAEGSSKQRERDGKLRYKPSPRESKWKDQDQDRVKETDRNRDYNRHRDSPKSGGSRRDVDSDQLKSKPGKFERDDDKNGELPADKNSNMAGKEPNAKERVQGYQKHRDDYWERKAAKSNTAHGERSEKSKADLSRDAKSVHGQNSSHRDKRVDKEGSNLKSDEGKSVKLDDDKGMPSASQVENAGSSETKDESTKDAKGRKVRYRDRPERAIYNPAQRAAQRRKEMEARGRSKDSPETSRSPDGGGNAE